MPNWNDILSECTRESSFDIVRRKYLKALREKTGRNNIIIYYSCWLQKPQFANQPGIELGITDGDKNGFMATIKDSEPFDAQGSPSMARLTSKARGKLPGSTFAGPNRSFPIPNKAHARAALQDLPRAKGLSSGEKAHIRSTAESKLHSADSRRDLGKDPMKGC